MTKKDYELIARALRDTMLIDIASADELRGATKATRSACARVAAALATENPRFDRARFLAACGVAS